MKTDPYLGTKSIADFTVKWMEVHDFSQAGLADHLKVSKSMVNFIVRGKDDALPLPFIRRFAKLLTEREKEVVRTILYNIVTRGLE